MFDIIVIGAGFAGTLSALKLPKHLKVLVIEAGDEVLPVISSSYNECYKLHTGMHYVGDAYTAKHCLIKSIEFARELPGFIAGGDDLWSPWRRGRHYFMSNSLVTTEQAKEIAVHLQNVYTQMVADDEQNKLFGEPENFIRFLTREDYPHIAKNSPFYDANGNVSSISVTLGIETAESQIDIERIKSHLQKQIAASPNITFLPSTAVTFISHNADQLGYVVSVENKHGEAQEFVSSGVINCSWQNIEKLDRTLGVYIPDENRVVRIKASILVQLPESLKNMNTCIFSSGPYCSMTVLPNGTAILTSERTTNVGYFKAGTSELPEDIRDCLKNLLKLDSTEGQIIANQIREECASYLAEELRLNLIHAPITELRVGFVKLIENKAQYTQESIYKADSTIHARQQDGIEVRDLGYISNSGMKMTYTVGNAAIVENIMTEHLAIIRDITQLTQLIKEIILPLPVSLRQHESTINSLLYVIYKENMKKTVLSDEYRDDPNQCAKKFAQDIITTLNKQHHITGALLQSFSMFKKDEHVTKEQTPLQQPKI